MHLLVCCRAVKTLALATVVPPARAARLEPPIAGLLDRLPETAYAMIAASIAAEAVHDHPARVRIVEARD